MHIDDDNIKQGDEEGVFSGGIIGEDVLDEFSDADTLIDPEDLPSLHPEDEDEHLFDFFGDEDDRDSMY